MVFVKYVANILSSNIIHCGTNNHGIIIMRFVNVWSMHGPQASGIHNRSCLIKNTLWKFHASKFTAYMIYAT